MRRFTMMHFIRYDPITLCGQNWREITYWTHSQRDWNRSKLRCKACLHSEKVDDERQLAQDDALFPETTNEE